MPIRQTKRNKRLKREYEQFLENPIPNCGAEPLESNIGIWHVNIQVPELDGAVFHFVVTYPENYPDVAPKIVNCSYIKHENVFDDYICLDILSMSEETKNTPFRGWTTAYTISSLLVQLQAFLFESMGDVKGSQRKRMIREARQYYCPISKHSGLDNIRPPILCTREKIEKEQNSSACILKEEVFFLEEMDYVVQSVLYEFCDEGTLAKLRFLKVGGTEAIDLALEKKVYKCYYTLKTIDKKGVVIGIGAKKACMDRVSRATRERKRCLQQLHCSFDFISQEAYKSGVRNNVWKDRDFDCFIPLYINKSHGKYSLPAAEKYILELWNTSGLANHYRRITPDLILATLSKLMNTTVVNMMKKVEDLEAGELQMFDSIKALEGFTGIHHLLLAFCEKYPDIEKIATQRVKRFVESSMVRDKEITPDIGELLIDVALSTYTWDDFSPFWIEECFVRNARWILAKHPNLMELEAKSSCVRLNQSFEATRTGQRLAMFQRFFITEVASPDRLKGEKNKNRILLSEYNRRLGRPPKGMAEKLQGHSRRVLACDNWWDYFELVNFCPPSVDKLSSWLRNSVEVSKLKKYHNERNIWKYCENWVTRPSQTLQHNACNCICAKDLYRLPNNCKVVPGGPKPRLVNKKEAGIDICFVLDCTGSMGSWINSAKESITNIIQEVTRKCDRDVRFAIAGYRDHHSQGYGSDAYVVRSFDFTDDPSEAKRNVSKFSAAGGADYPEAMCCAMKAAADMKWNRDSHQIVITIADAPPHGLITRHDDFPDGCECGQDSLRIAHTMRQNGIVIYTVDCGSTDAVRQTFFHALARITGGYAMDLQDAKLLPKVVLGACMEETALDKMSDKIAPLYEYCLTHHPEGRFEQHCQAVFSECKAKNLCIESSLPPDSYDYSEEHQVKSFAFCMDLKQAKAIHKQEYFIPIKRKTKLCSHMERPVTLQQITKCMKRMKNVLALRKLMKEGCQYKSSKRFTNQAFQIRWKKFNQNRNIRANFEPWAILTTEEKKKLQKIPDGTKVKKIVGTSKADGRNFKKELVGKEIEIFRNDTWITVRVLKILKIFKVSVEYEGFQMTINDKTKWRHLPGSVPEEKPKEEEAKKPVAVETPAVVAQEKIPIREEEKKEKSAAIKAEEAKRPAAPAATKPIARAVPAPAPAVSKAKIAAAPRPAPTGAPKFSIGQLVYCRNERNKPWRVAVIGSVSPLGVRYQNDTPSSPLQTARFFCPIRLTDWVCRCATLVLTQPDERYRTCPTHHLMSGTKIQILEVVNNFAHVVQPVQGWISCAHLAKPTSTVIPETAKINISNATETARINISNTTETAPAPAPAPPAPPKTKKFICKDNLKVYAYPNPNKNTFTFGVIEAATIVEVINFVGDYAQISSPKEGWIRAKNKSRKLIIEAGMKIDKVLPTLIISNVPEDCTAKDLATKCTLSGFPPKGIRIGKDGEGNRIAQLVFETHGHADCIKALGLVHFETVMKITWLEKYLKYREVAL